MLWLGSSPTTWGPQRFHARDGWRIVWIPVSTRQDESVKVVALPQRDLCFQQEVTWSGSVHIHRDPYRLSWIGCSCSPLHHWNPSLPKPILAVINGTAAGGVLPCPGLWLPTDGRDSASETSLHQSGTLFVWRRNLVPSTFSWTWTCPGDCSIRWMDLRRPSTELGFGQPSCASGTTHSRKPELGKPFGWPLQPRLHNCQTTTQRILEHSLETKLEHERQGLVRTVEQSDGQEGLSAFLEKRSPRFAWNSHSSPRTWLSFQISPHSTEQRGSSSTENWPKDQATQRLGTVGDFSATARSNSANPDPQIKNPTLFLFAQTMGLPRRSQRLPQEVTRQMVLNFLSGGAAVNVFCRQNGWNWKIIDAGVCGELPADANLISAKIAQGTRNLLTEAAMTPNQCTQAISIGAQLIRDYHAQEETWLVSEKWELATPLPPVCWPAACSMYPWKIALGAVRAWMNQDWLTSNICCYKVLISSGSSESLGGSRYFWGLRISDALWSLRCRQQNCRSQYW